MHDRGMSQEIDWGGIKIPIGDWEATPASVKAAFQEMVQPLTERLESKDAENGQLKQRVAELEEKGRRNSKNSSQPPSKDGFGSKEAPQGKPRPGRKKPVKFQEKADKGDRQLYTPEECQAVYEVKAEVCRHCGEGLSGVDAHPSRHQVVDIPQVKPSVLEYRGA